MHDPRVSLYQEFLDFVRMDIQGERRLANRRMFNVFFWCFLLPAVLSLVLMVLIKMGMVRWSLKRYTDWIIVGFPVSFGLYVIGVDVLKDMPRAYRSGGIGSALGRLSEEAIWRDRVCADMRKRFLSADSRFARTGLDGASTWSWLVKSFEIDLRNFQHRTRYLTALAGTVFFLLLQGLDLMDDKPHRVEWTATSILGFFESSSNNATQFAGLALFLVLLYLTGNQSYHSLLRYQHCAELIETEEQNK